MPDYCLGLARMDPPVDIHRVVVPEVRDESDEECAGENQREQEAVIPHGWENAL